MIWLNHKARQIEPGINSLRTTTSHQRHADMQQNLHQQQTNWKIIASIVSLMMFLLLFTGTIVGSAVILTREKYKLICPTTFSTSVPTSTDGTGIDNGSIRLCTANASWSSTGVTVAGLASGLPSASLDGLQFPNDIFVYGNGTVLVADTNNNRVTKWDPNAAVGVLIAGTGSYGSWSTLLAKPMSLTVRGDQLYVNDYDNYRIQVFPLNTNVTSPDATTIIGRYGQGSGLNQVDQVAGLIAPMRFPSLLYLSDSFNHRILLYDFQSNLIKVVAGTSGVLGVDSTHLYGPFGIALHERTNALYIADRYNNRIQKYDMNGVNPTLTVAGWGQLNTPYGVQVDPQGVNLFIADTLNHRVLVWLNGTVQGRIIAGDGTAGNSMTQLNNPTQIRFDAKYNLYVVDTNNCRIQRFDLISNGC